jgi:hypothetical protein
MTYSQTKTGCWIAITAVILMITGCSGTSTESADAIDSSKQVSIAFVDRGAIRSWRALDSDSLYLEDSHRQWYKATFWSRCAPLRYTSFLRLNPDDFGRLDRFGSITVNGETCNFRSLELSEDPALIKEQMESEQENDGEE